MTQPGPPREEQDEQAAIIYPPPRPYLASDGSDAKPKVYLLSSPFSWERGNLKTFIQPPLFPWDAAFGQKPARFRGF